MAKKKDKSVKKVESVQTPVVEPANEGDKPGDSEEKPKEEASPKESPEKPKEEERTGLPTVPLKVFCTLSGKKPDQMAGFKNYAKRSGLKPMTIPQWKEAFVEFQNKPMR